MAALGGRGVSRRCAASSASRSRSASPGSGCSAGCRLGRAGFGARTQKSPGQVSRVRSAFVEMELDHDTGAMRGRILAGPHEGAALDALDVATLAAACCPRSTRKAARY